MNQKTRLLSYLQSQNLLTTFSYYFITQRQSDPMNCVYDKNKRKVFRIQMKIFAKYFTLAYFCVTVVHKTNFIFIFLSKEKRC